MQDFQQRVIDERQELIVRLDKLTEFLKGEIIKTLPEDEQFRLTCQHEIMTNYANVLAERIAHFIEPAQEVSA